MVLRASRVTDCANLLRDIFLLERDPFLSFLRLQGHTTLEVVNCEPFLRMMWFQWENHGSDDQSCLSEGVQSFTKRSASIAVAAERFRRDEQAPKSLKYFQLVAKWRFPDGTNDWLAGEVFISLRGFRPHQ